MVDSSDHRKRGLAPNVRRTVQNKHALRALISLLRPKMSIETIEHTTTDTAIRELARSTVPQNSRQIDGDHPAIARMKSYAELSGLPFMCVDPADWSVLNINNVELPIIPPAIRKRLADQSDGRVVELKSGLIYYALPLPEIDGHSAIALGFVFSRPDARPHEAVVLAAELGWTQQKLNDWRARQRYCQSEILQRLLAATLAQAGQQIVEDQLESELQKLSTELEQTYEEISLLHSLTGNLQISRSPVDLAELCLDRMSGLIPADGNIIWLEERKRGTQFLLDGEVPFDEAGMLDLVGRFESHDWTRPLVKNHMEGTPLGADFPGIRNFVIVPIAEGMFRSGWIVNYNIEEGREFGTVEASLLNSIATILGTHIRNIDLYRQHEELLVSFVRSMVSSLDAKDPYTRGHSERVALIGRRLAKQLNLSTQQQQDIHLSGLLHDVGKIGVNDAILQKPGRLTEDEFDQIKKHPTIGYEILKGLENLQHVLPGVRSHHEQVNGRGYPDGLVGDEIPLMARILAVADSYDAMTSDRPYRKGMPLEKVESIFREMSGSQWDPQVIDAYFAARNDVARICSDYLPTSGSLLEGKDSLSTLT